MSPKNLRKLRSRSEEICATNTKPKLILNTGKLFTNTHRFAYDVKNVFAIFYIPIIPHLTHCFRKLNIVGAACLLDKISLKKRTLDFSM